MELQERVIPFKAGDGMDLNLVNVRGADTSRGPVLLVHGAGVRANIFRAPVKQDIVKFLAANGYDVWLENWRASIEVRPNEWTLDQAALYDHPQAVKTVIAETGAAEMKAIIHCQGSTSFTMSAMAGLVPEVKTIVSNAVSLHPIVPDWSKVKLNAFLPLIGIITDYLNPGWGLEADTGAGKLVDFFVRATHHEDETAVSKHVSFTYGAGFPALWNHENLNDATQAWLQYEFKHVPIRFFNQIKKCVRKGSLVSVEGRPELPADYAKDGPKTEARWAFFAGRDNKCFRYESQVESFEYFEARQPGVHSLHVIEDYGHLDIFMGQDAARDVFPIMLAELEK
jgi:pimeloyl-ACP methyl ester carboxylesterase